MTAKLEKIHEMYKLLNEKERVNHDILSTFGRFGLSQALRRLGLEKQQGVSALQLIISLCLFRFNGESVFGIRVFNMMYPDFVPFLSKPFFF